MTEHSNSDIPFDFPDIRERVSVAFGMYGITAVEKIVNDLATEADAAKELANAVDDLESEKLTVRFPVGEFEKIYSIAFLLEDTVHDSELAQKRLAFARELFEVAKQDCAGEPA